MLHAILSPSVEYWDVKKADALNLIRLLHRFNTSKRHNLCSAMYTYPFFQYWWCSVRCARHQHYFTFSTRCTLYCQHMSRGKLFLPIFRGSGPHTSSWKKGEKKSSKLLKLFINAFMEEFLPHLELLTWTPVIYVHLLAHHRELALQVAVHYTPINRVTLTRIPQPYM